MYESLARAAARADVEGFSQAIVQATGVMLAERKSGRIAGGSVKGGLVELADMDRLAVIGDLHGDTQTLFRMLDRVGPDFLSDSRNKMVFLGDYVDRGSDSVGVLYSVCSLKATYPDSVVLMRGNHEAPSEFPFSPQDMPYEMQDRFGSGAKALYRQALSLFRLMTLAVLVKDRIMLVHGGLPTETFDPRMIQDAQENHVKNRVLEELLWNDPRPVKGWARSHRGIGRYFGPDVTQMWLKSTNTKAVVRGHEPCSGFRVDHEGLVLTLFSSKEPYPTFGAAYLLVDADRLEKVETADDLAKHATRL